MTRAALTVALVVCLATAGAASARTGAEPLRIGVGKQPALQVLLRAPLTVGGWRFKVGEHVTVFLTRPDGVRRRQAVAGALGRFTVTFAAVRTTVCDAVFVRATGSRGSRAQLRAILPACKPAVLPAVAPAWRPATGRSS